MNLENCFICKRPVLELDGQFEVLDSYFLNENDAAYQHGAFGWCHSYCLSISPWGSHWSQLRILHFTNTRGYYKSYCDARFTILGSPRADEKLVFQNDGVSFTFKDVDIEGKKEYQEGLFIPVAEEINLELDDPELIRIIRSELINKKSFPLRRLIDALSLGDCLLHQKSVATGDLILNHSLQKEWIGNYLSVDVLYKKFLPGDIVVAALRTLNTK